jgi:hypothetical protein
MCRGETMLGLTPCLALLWAGGGGAVRVIFLLEGIIEASVHHARDGYGMKVPVCSFQQ